MSKRDDLDRVMGANIDESMGRHPSVHGVPSSLARTVPARLQGLKRRGDVADIPLDRIVRDPSQPREDFEAEGLQQLAKSLQERGQLQPIRVRWDDAQERYVILVGERRWRAALMAGLATLACIVVEAPLDAAERLTIQLVENALREDLKPVEQARVYLALIEARGWTVRQLATELAISHPTVIRALSLLELPPSVQAQVEEGKLPPATAYEISKVEDPAAQAELAAEAVAKNLSRSEIVAAVRERKARTASQGRGAKKPRKVTTRTFRLPGRYKLAITCPSGITPEGLLAAWEALGAAIRAEPPEAHEGQGGPSVAA